MADEAWHVGVRGERKGPFSEQQVKEMIGRGEVTARDVVWKEGMEDWLPASQVETFAEAIKAAPPPPPAPPGGANPFALYFTNFWRHLRGILVDPEAGLATAADNKDLCFSITWIVLGIIVFAFLCLQYSALRFGLGPDFAKEGTMFLKGLLHGLIIYAIWFGVLLLTLVPILKSQATWVDVLSVLGLSTIPLAAIGLAAFAVIWIDRSEPIFTVLLWPAAVASVLVYYRVFCHLARASARAALCAVPATYLVSLLVYHLLRLAMK